MSLSVWLREGKLRQHETTKQEIYDLFQVVDRDIRDSGISALSPDRRYMTSYNAVMQLATIVLRVSGYRSSGLGHHWITFQALPFVMGDTLQGLADYFNGCRSKRNTADYDAAGGISDLEVAELYNEALLFRSQVINWLRESHLDLIPEGLSDQL